MVIGIFPIFYWCQGDIRIISVGNNCCSIILRNSTTNTVVVCPINTAIDWNLTIFYSSIIILDFLYSILICFCSVAFCNTNRQIGNCFRPNISCPTFFVGRGQSNFYYICRCIVTITIEQISVAGLFQVFPVASVIFLILNLESNATIETKTAPHAPLTDRCNAV